MTAQRDTSKDRVPKAKVEPRTFGDSEKGCCVVISEEPSHPKDYILIFSSNDDIRCRSAVE